MLFFPGYILKDDHPICQLKAINEVAALNTWGPQLQSSLVHLYTDNTTVNAILQLNRGKDAYI